MSRISIPSQQASNGFPITPSDTTDISSDAGNTAGVTMCYVHVSGTSGLVKVDTAAGDTISVYGVQGNILGGNMPIQVRRIWSNGTTATTLVALWGKGGMY